MNADDRPVTPSWHDRRVSRRGFLAGVAGVSAGAMVGVPAVAHAAPAGDGLHGVQLRGMYLTSKNRLAEGRFGAMFKRLPAFAPRDDLLTGLAETMVEEPGVPNDDVHLNTSRAFSRGSRSSGSSSTTTSRSITHRSICSSRTPMQPSTSGRRATTWTRSTVAGRLRSPSSTIRPTGTSCW